MKFCKGFTLGITWLLMNITSVILKEKLRFIEISARKLHLMMIISMIPYQMILLNCIGCQWSKGLISRSWSLRIRLSTINHLITSPACFNYRLIPGTSAPHLLHLNLFSLELIISRLPIVPFHVMHLTNGINCLLKSEMLIPSLSSKDFWNLISLNLLMDSSYVSFYCAKAP